MTNVTLSEQNPNLIHRLKDLLASIEEKFSSNGWIEICILTIVSMAIAIIFANFARGGVNSSDISLYLNLGMNGIKMPFVLNRYFHIFLQQIFVEFASSPLEGYHAFWGFLMGANFFLIYLTARKIRQDNTILHGVLAVLIFFSLTALQDVSGIIVVDLTAMTILMLFFMIYVLSMNKGHSNPWLVATLGFVLYLAFKTKETTLPVAVLLIGLGWIGSKDFSWHSLLKNLVWVACGLAAGIIFFGILSWIILGDPLFGLRISEWVEFYNTYAVYSSRVLDTLNIEGASKFEDWYRGYWFEVTFLPFLLYLISGIKNSVDNYFPRKFLYLVPLAIVVFLLISINNRIGYDSRFSLPALPVLSVLAVQFIDLKALTGRGKRNKYWGFLAIGLILAIGIRLLLREIVPARGWDLTAVINLMFYPLLLTLLFTSVILFFDHAYWHLINFIVVVSLLISPITSNYRAMFIARKNEAAFLDVINPLMEFESDITFTSDMRFYATSRTFFNANLNIIKDYNELLSMFNILFEASSSAENFTYADKPNDIRSDITAEVYDYVLMTNNEWMILLEDDAEVLEVMELYKPQTSPNGRFVLLTVLD